jgi:succinoglycan biosynthesis protein ExoA
MILGAMSAASPSVSVIIPAREADDHIGAAVASALAQPEVDEVVVAAADAATRRAAEALPDPRVKTVDNPAGTTPAALNRALAVTSGEVIVRCDAHAVLPPHYVGRILETMAATGAANVGGRQVPRGETMFEQAVAMAMVSPIGAGDARYRIGGAPGPVDTVYLGSFSRRAIEQAGGFDETLVRNQDYELNWRLREAGGTVWFDPELAVTYRPRGSVPALWRQYFEYGFWKRVVLRRHPGSLRWRQLMPPALVAALAASVMVLPVDRRLAAITPAAYLAVTTGTGVFDAVRTGRAAGLLEPVALWTMHLAWGTGFIAGQLSGRR